MTSFLIQFKQKFISIILCWFVITGITFDLYANEQQVAQQVSVESTITSRVETYVDEYFPDMLEKTHTPGATFILVDRNGPLITRGYGKHSYENGNDIDPARHLFRIASITKTMTGLGIMKLVDEGKIDLDADVNQYFSRFQIPDTFEQPITARNLLQHNSGVSDEFVALNFTEIAAKRSMGDFLEQHVPGIGTAGEFSIVMYLQGLPDIFI